MPERTASRCADSPIAIIVPDALHPVPTECIRGISVIEHGVTPRPAAAKAAEDTSKGDSPRLFDALVITKLSRVTDANSERLKLLSPAAFGTRATVGRPRPRSLGLRSKRTDSGQRRAEDTDCLLGESGRIIRDAPVRSPARACYHRKTGRALRFALEHGAHRLDPQGGRVTV